jgi:hypothetical protein
LLWIYLLLKSNPILLGSNIPILSYSHFTMKTTILIATILAVTTVLAAGLTVVPGSVQEAQANPCSTELETDIESGEGSSISSPTSFETHNDERECNFFGDIDIYED